MAPVPAMIAGWMRPAAMPSSALAHDESLMLFEIPHRREEQGRVTEPEHHAGQIALTRGYAWLAGQILLRDRHR